MSNIKPEGAQKVKALYTLDAENVAFVKSKAPAFARGKRGGNSGALNAMIKFVRDWEALKAKEAGTDA